VTPLLPRYGGLLHDEFTFLVTQSARRAMTAQHEAERELNGTVVPLSARNRNKRRYPSLVFVTTILSSRLRGRFCFLTPRFGGMWTSLDQHTAKREEHRRYGAEGAQAL
jgi:hypothetical protein